MSKELALGFDLSKDSAVVGLAIDGGCVDLHKISFQNGRRKALEELILQLKRLYPEYQLKAAFEDGGKLDVYDQLSDLGIDCLVVPRHYISKSDKLRRNKNDFSDAQNLAVELSLGKIEGRYVFDKEHREFQLLVRTHRNLVQSRTKLIQDLRDIFESSDIKQPLKINESSLDLLIESEDLNREYSFKVKQLIQGYTDHSSQIKICRIEIEKWLSLPRYLEFTNALLRIKGISHIIAAELISELGDFGRFDSFYKFKSFCGLAPYRYQSGQTDRHYRSRNTKPPVLKRTFSDARRCLATHNDYYKEKKALFQKQNQRNWRINLEREFAKEIFHLWQC